MRHGVLAIAASLLLIAGLSAPAFAQEAPAADPVVTTPAALAATRALIDAPVDQPPTDPGLAVGVIVKFAPEGRVRALSVDLAAVGIDVVGTSSVFADTRSLRFAEAMSIEAAQRIADRLAARPDVLWAEPDRIVTAAVAPPVIPNDPAFPRQWSLWDPKALKGVDASIHAPVAWGTTTGSKDVVVAVIDTGITPHPDLDAAIIPGYDLISDPLRSRDGDGRDANALDEGDWVDNAAISTVSMCRGEPVSDSSWHGTHVAGIVAAVQGNGEGISGVAPGVSVQPVRVLGTCGGTLSDIAAGIVWAAGGTVPGVPVNPTPARVLNLSLGALLPCPRSYVDAIAGARARGAIVIAAAGNEAVAANRSAPANCAGVISVAATNRVGRLAPYSNYGTGRGGVDIAAPGGQFPFDGAIISTVNAGMTVPTTPDYVNKNGTSMAAPIVAGAAALVYSMGDTDPDEVTERLLGATRDFPVGGSAGTACTTDRCGVGLLDLAKLFTAVPGRPESLEGDRVSSTEVNLIWLPPADPGDAPVTGYVVQQSTDAGRSWTEVTRTVNRFAQLSGLDPRTRYRFRVAAESQMGLGAWSQPTPVILLSTEWSKPVQLTRILGSGSTCCSTDYDFAVNSYGDGIAAVIFANPNRDDMWTHIYVYRYIDGLWQAPEAIPLPAAYRRIDWDWNRPKVAVSDSGQAVVGFQGSLVPKEGYQDLDGAFASYSQDIYEPDSFGVLTRLHGDAEAPNIRSLDIAMGDGGTATAVWSGVSDEGEQGATYASVRSPNLSWSSPDQLGVSLRHAGEPSVAAYGMTSTVAFIQGQRDKCKDDQDQTVMCFIPSSATYNFNGGEWSGAAFLDIPGYAPLSNIKVGQSQDATAFAWDKEVPDPYVDATTWRHPRGVVSSESGTGTARNLPVPVLDASYAVTGVAVSKDGEAIVTATGLRYLGTWYGYDVKRSVEIFESQSGSWRLAATARVEDFIGQGQSDGGLGLQSASDTRDGAVVAWNCNCNTPDNMTSAPAVISGVRRVNGTWVPLGDLMEGGGFSVAPAVGQDLTGATTLVVDGYVPNAWGASAGTAAITLANRGLRQPAPPTSVGLADALPITGELGLQVSMARPVKTFFVDPVDRYWTRISWRAQLYRIGDDSVVNEVEGATCSSSDYYQAALTCTIPGPLPDGRYLARSYATLDGISSISSPWSDPFTLTNPVRPLAPRSLGVSASAAPGAVTALKATPGKRRLSGRAWERWVDFTWSAPASDGSPVTRYRYRLKVGKGSWSSWITTATASVRQKDPAAKTAIAIQVHAVRDPVTVAWTAPLYPGASPITGYRVEAKRAADPVTAYRVIAASIPASPYVPGGLQKGDYAFRVTALNARGVGDPSYDAYGTVGDPVSGATTTVTGATPA